MTEPPLELVPYDPAWPERYEEERARIRGALGELVVEIHHIGSTSVPGLLAKPVIDILLGLRRLDLSRSEIEAMAKLGFDYRGEYGIPDRCFFTKTDCHVHGFLIGGGQWHSHLLVRDFLRADPDVRDRYGALKWDIATRVGWDRTRYVAEKERLVDRLLREARERLP